MNFVEVEQPLDLADEFPAPADEGFYTDDPFYDDAYSNVFDNGFAQTTVPVTVPAPIQPLRPLTGPPVSRLFHDIGRQRGDPPGMSRSTAPSITMETVQSQSTRRLALNAEVHEREARRQEAAEKRDKRKDREYDMRVREFEERREERREAREARLESRERSEAFERIQAESLKLTRESNQLLARLLLREEQQREQRRPRRHHSDEDEGEGEDD